ncbi:hypothetical protein [Henriciella aquimarina]|uniref:hypothetical protein n=1 Tax=Henriciella aquimarina TaxID=545261 RepID=UPI001302010A|nr:hypothetical protein [Henriciella aquimarina]
MKEWADQEEESPDARQQPDFLVDGWFGFFNRLMFVISFLALMVIIFVAMTDLWKLF